MCISRSLELDTAYKEWQLMQFIKENPYRVLGILANSTERELQKQIARVKRFAEIGKNATSELDFEFLGLISRTNDDIQAAASKIEQSHKKIPHALNWFISINNFDEIAINSLKEGNVEKAIDIWDKTLKTEISSRNYSSYNNLSTLYTALAFQGRNLDLKQLSKGVYLKSALFKSAYFQDFCKLIGGEDAVLDKEKIIKHYVDSIVENIAPHIGNKQDRSLKTLTIFKAYPEYIKKYLFDKFTQAEYSRVESKIAETESKRSDDESDANEAAEELYQSTKKDVEYLKSVLDKNDVKLQLLLNNLADELIQCAIDYFNFWCEDDTSDEFYSNALTIAEYAIALEPTGQVKQRIEENTQNIKNWAEDAKNSQNQQEIEERFELLAQKIKQFDNGHQSITTVHSFLNTSKTILDEINSIDGLENELTPNNAVVLRVMNTCVHLYNTHQDELINKKISPDAFTEKVNAIIAIFNKTKTIKMSNEIRIRLDKNSNDIREIRQKTVTHFNKSNSGACYIATMAYGDYDHPQVIKLRRFRDDVLAKNILGRMFIKCYYAVSPKLVQLLKDKKQIHKLTRKILDKWIHIIKF